MVTSSEYARLSLDVYENKISLPENWVQYGQAGANSYSGFYGQAYKNTVTGESVIAYMGRNMGTGIVFCKKRKSCQSRQDIFCGIRKYSTFSIPSKND